MKTGFTSMPLGMQLAPRKNELSKLVTEDHIVIPSDKTARFETKHGHLDVYYDSDHDIVLAFSSAAPALRVIPRAGNSVAFELLDKSERDRGDYPDVGMTSAPRLRSFAASEVLS